jgi:hypothetical protein
MMNPTQGASSVISASTGTAPLPAAETRLRPSTVRRRRTLCLVGVIALVAAVTAGVAISQAMRGAQALQVTDALVFQAAGRIINAHGCVYCLAAERSAQMVLLGGHLQANGVEAFNNPPLLAWLVQPVAGLSLSGYTLLSILVEAAALVAGLFIAKRLLAGSVELPLPLLVVALALVAPLPGLETLLFAQWVGLMLAALLGAYLLARANHGFAAGPALSLLFVKPQDIWLVPIVLIVARAWPMLLGLAAGAGIWLLTSVVVVSVGTLAHLTGTLGQNQSQIPFTDGLPGIAAALAGSGWAVIVAGLGIAFAVAALPLGDRLRRDPMLTLDIGIALSLLFSPHVFSADILLMGAVLIDLGRRDLTLAVGGALVLDVAYLLEAPVFHTTGHVEAVALLCVTAIVVAVASRHPHADVLGSVGTTWSTLSGRPRRSRSTIMVKGAAQPQRRSILGIRHTDAISREGLSCRLSAPTARQHEVVDHGR